MDYVTVKNSVYIKFMNASLSDPGSGSPDVLKIPAELLVPAQDCWQVQAQNMLDPLNKAKNLANWWDVIDIFSSKQAFTLSWLSGLVPNDDAWSCWSHTAQQVLVWALL